MFEIIFILLFGVFSIVFLTCFKKLLEHFEKQKELKQKEVLALVNLRESISKFNDDLVNLEVDCLFKK